jgi:hypothetical protein
MERPSGCNRPLAGIGMLLAWFLYAFFRQRMSQPIVILFIAVLILAGAVQFALFAYVQRRLGVQAGSGEATDAWFGKSMPVQRVRSRLFTLFIGGTGCMASGVFCLMLEI